MKILKTNSAVLATIVVIIFIALITVVSELLPSLKTWLKDIFGHHWVGKGILSALLWIIIAVIPTKLDILKPKLLLLTTAVSALIIIIFYVLHYSGIV